MPERWEGKRSTLFWLKLPRYLKISKNKRAHDRRIEKTLLKWVSPVPIITLAVERDRSCCFFTSPNSLGRKWQNVLTGYFEYVREANSTVIYEARVKAFLLDSLTIKRRHRVCVFNIHSIFLFLLQPDLIGTGRSLKKSKVSLSGSPLKSHWCHYDKKAEERRKSRQDKRRPRVKSFAENWWGWGECETLFSLSIITTVLQ